MSSQQTMEILSDLEHKAVSEFVARLKELYIIKDIIIFGSFVWHGRGFGFDLLVLIKERATHRLRNEIAGIVFEINLKYGTNISAVVVNFKEWNGELMGVTRFYAEVKREGVKF